MISSKLLSILSSNVSILRSQVSTKPNVLSVWSHKHHDSNKNAAVIGRKCYCTKQNEQIILPKVIVTKNKLPMTEEDRKLLERWLEMHKFQGFEVPQEISEQQFHQLYLAVSESQRNKYLRYLVKREENIINSKVKKEKEKALKAELCRERENRSQGHIKYGLWKNSMFSKVNKRHFVDLCNHRLTTSMQFGQPLIFDLGFAEHLNGREKGSYVRQLTRVITCNRGNDDPFNLTFCNVNFDNDEFKKFTTQMPGVLKPGFPMNISSESYLDLFPKEKLVYLSPDAKEEMKDFDHDAIYIIGGIVNLGRNEPHTLAKAMKEIIKMQKLPLDRYLVFNRPKCLGISLMMRILLSVKKDGDWKKAFQSIPEHFLQKVKDS